MRIRYEPPNDARAMVEKESGPLPQAELRRMTMSSNLYGDEFSSVGDVLEDMAVVVAFVVMVSMTVKTRKVNDRQI